MTQIEYFDGGCSKKVAHLLKQAKAKNDMMDSIERESGFKSPSECDCDLALRTALSAFYAGMHLQDWGCIAEGVQMVRDIECKMRKQMKGGNIT